MKIFTVSKQLERVKTLVVDDNPHMRKLVGKVLEAFGSKDVLHADSAEKALDICHTAKPDIIILDWLMPGGMDGIKFTYSLRNDPDSPCPFVPVIMLTAHSGVDQVRAARDAGVNEFLIKPISVASLYSRIYSIIETPRPFVKTAAYFGPDRRRTRKTEYVGPERRESEGVKPSRQQAFPATDLISGKGN